MKLRLEDIRILDRYEQLSNAIKGKFESIDALDAELGYSNDTLSRYLRDPELLSPGKHSKLKGKIFTCLGRSLAEILLNDEDQVRGYIDLVCSCIDKYNSEGDANVFERLESLCLEHNIKTHLAHLYKAWGKHCYNMKFPLQANKYYWKAVELYKTIYANDDIIKCYNDIGYVYTYIGNYNEAKKIFCEADSIIKKYNSISSETLFFHYYRWGILLNKEQIGEHSYAREKFSIAMSYARNNNDLGNSYLNIGLSHKKQKQYSQAREYYKMALETYGDMHSIQSGIAYNNFAELEKCAGNYHEALIHIKKAIDITNGIYNQEYIVFFQTYAQIKAHLGEHEDTLKVLIRMIKDYKNHHLHKYFEVAAIRTILEFGNFELKLLKELKDIVYNLIVSTGDECSSYAKELIECLGETELAILKLNRGIN